MVDERQLSTLTYGVDPRTQQVFTGVLMHVGRMLQGGNGTLFTGNDMVVLPLDRIFESKKQAMAAMEELRAQGHV